MKLIRRVNSQRRSKKSEFDPSAYRAKPPQDCSSSEKLHASKKQRLEISCKRLTIYILAVLIMLLTIIIGMVFTLNTTEYAADNEINKFPSFVANNENTTLRGHITFTKSQWGGRPALNFTRPLLHPTEYVLISHTAGRFCHDYEECAPMLQTMQSEHVGKLKSPDIGYNFLIGGDGNVYVGRGWDIRNFHRDNNIGISFMGNFIFDDVTPRMVSALKELLEVGVKLNKLRPDYKLVCHNQTSATLSPGGNVFKEIVKFPNYYPGHVRIP